MKILRKGDEFVKLLDSTQKDLIKIHSFIERGWRFAQKKEYKSFMSGETKQKVKDEEKTDKKDKKVKEVKEVKTDKAVKKEKEVKKEKDKGKKVKK